MGAQGRRGIEQVQGIDRLDISYHPQIEQFTN